MQAVHHDAHHPEHLNTPRLVANDQQQTVWRWDQQEPFGANACNPDPDGDNVEFEFNLRFPGQYFDRETNQHYNYFRDYDPALGRYTQSDPIGLRGGVNTYAYVAADPLRRRDRFGLDWVLMDSGRPMNTIGCRGENIDVLLEDPDNDFYKCGAIMRCRRVHEEVHVEDVLRSRPGICAGNIGVRWIGNTSDESRLDSELRAFLRQLSCLKEVQRSACLGPECETEVRVYIRSLEGTTIPRVRSGQY